MSLLSSRDFNRDVSAAERAAQEGPVIITDRGEPSHVLLSFEDHRDLAADQRSIVDRLPADDDVDVDVETEPLDIGLRVPEL